MPIENSSVVTSAYLDRIIAEIFDGNGQRLYFENSSILVNIYLNWHKAGLSAAMASAFASWIALS